MPGIRASSAGISWVKLDPQALDTATEESRIEGRRRLGKKSDRLDQLCEMLEHNSHLHAGELCSGTNVRAEAEGQMVARVHPVDSEFVRRLVIPIVTVRRAKTKLDLLAFGELGRV